jgi:hypothetical protein
MVPVASQNQTNMAQDSEQDSFVDQLEMAQYVPEVNAPHAVKSNDVAVASNCDGTPDHVSLSMARNKVSNSH